VFAQLDRDQETNALLAGDVRRSMRITSLVVGSFAVVLLFGANIESAATFVWVVGVPLGLLSLLARLLARWCGDTTVGRVRVRRTRPVEVDASIASESPMSSPGEPRRVVEVAAPPLCRARPAQRPTGRPVGWDHDLPRQCDD